MAIGGSVGGRGGAGEGRERKCRRAFRYGILVRRWNGAVRGEVSHDGPFFWHSPHCADASAAADLDANQGGCGGLYLAVLILMHAN